MVLPVLTTRQRIVEPKLRLLLYITYIRME